MKKIVFVLITIFATCVSVYGQELQSRVVFLPNNFRPVLTVTGDSSDEIREGIAIAPEGAVIYCRPGNYLITDPIRPKNGQVIFGPNAVFIREPALVTQLAESAEIGDESLAVVDSSKYRIGDRVTPIRPGAGDPDIEVLHYRIIGIENQRLFLHHGIQSAYSQGDLVSNYFNMIESSDPFSVVGVTFQGNRESQAFYSWKRNRTIVGNAGLEVRSCRFQDMPGDGIDTLGGNVVIENNIFERIDTAGIHLSNDFVEEGDTLIRGNVFHQTNLRFVSAEHSEGAITISLRNNHIRVVDNLCFDCPAAFIGDFHIDMYDWTIEGNLVINAGRGMFRGKQNNNGPLPLRDIEIANNKVFDSEVSVLNTLMPIHGINIHQNEFKGARVRFVDTYGSFSDNIVWTCDEPPIEVSGGGVSVTDNMFVDNYCGDSYRSGDMNVDGQIDLEDVQLFVEVLVAGYYHPIADLDGDGQIDLKDIQPFIQSFD